MHNIPTVKYVSINFEFSGIETLRFNDSQGKNETVGLGKQSILHNIVDNSNRYAGFESTCSVFADAIQGMDAVGEISQATPSANETLLQPIIVIKAELRD